MDTPAANEGTIKRLILELRSSRLERRQQAADALVELGPDAIAPLCEFLRGPWDLKHDAAIAVGRIAERQAKLGVKTPALVAALPLLRLHLRGARARQLIGMTSDPTQERWLERQVEIYETALQQVRTAMALFNDLPLPSAPSDSELLPLPGRHPSNKRAG